MLDALGLFCIVLSTLIVVATVTVYGRMEDQHRERERHLLNELDEQQEVISDLTEILLEGSKKPNHPSLSVIRGGNAR